MLLRIGKATLLVAVGVTEPKQKLEASLQHNGLGFVYDVVAIPSCCRAVLVIAKQSLFVLAHSPNNETASLFRQFAPKEINNKPKI